MQGVEGVEVVVAGEEEVRNFHCGFVYQQGRSRSGFLCCEDGTSENRGDLLAAVTTFLVTVRAVVFVPLASLDLGCGLSLRDRGREGQRQDGEDEV